MTTPNMDATLAYDIAIIGGGAAGLSAALTAGRARRRVLVIDGAEPRNRFAHTVNNTLGIVDTSPLELLQRGREQLEPYDVDLRTALVTEVNNVTRGLELVLDDGTTHYARAALLATGLTDDLPAVDGLQTWWGSDIFQCPYCHGWEVRGQRLGVLVSSPVGFHQAAMARQWSDDVTVFSTDAAPALQPGERSRLEARGVTFVDSPAQAALGGDSLEALRTADGATHELDALLIAPTPRPNEQCLDPLGLRHSETPFGTFLEVDQQGRTSHPRIWATGNVVDPGVNVPLAIGQATIAAGVMNFALIEEDMDTAVLSSADWSRLSEPDYWEELYSRTGARWSSGPNPELVAAVDTLRESARQSGSEPDAEPIPRTADPADGSRTRKRPTAVDLGCGEGSDAIWLAQQGWDTTGVDVSATAVERAESAARAAEVPVEHLRFNADGVLGVGPSRSFDLVCASYLHAPAQAERDALLERAGQLVAPDGHLFLLSHHHGDDAGPEHSGTVFDPAQWETVQSWDAPKKLVMPDSTVGERFDEAVLLRRRERTSQVS